MLFLGRTSFRVWFSWVGQVQIPASVCTSSPLALMMVFSTDFINFFFIFIFFSILFHIPCYSVVFVFWSSKCNIFVTVVFVLAEWPMGKWSSSVIMTGKILVYSSFKLLWDHSCVVETWEWWLSGIALFAAVVVVPPLLFFTFFLLALEQPAQPGLFPSLLWRMCHGKRGYCINVEMFALILCVVCMDILRARAWG